MGLAGDRRRRRWRTSVLAAGLAMLVTVSAAGGGDPGPPAPLPPLPPARRDDISLAIGAERHGDGVRVDVELAIAARGDALRVRRWDEATVVGERLEHGQVVLHLGLESAYPDIPDDVYTYAARRPRPPLLVLPGRTLEDSLDFGGAGAQVDDIRPAGRSDVLALDEVRVCIWAERDTGPGHPGPTICADDEV